MQNYTQPNRLQYFADILILIGLVILSAVIFGLLGTFIGQSMLKMDFSEVLGILTGGGKEEHIGFLKIYNVFTTFGAWVVSGFLLFKIRSYKVSQFWKFNPPVINKTWLLLPLVFISAIFLASVLLKLNQDINFPKSIVDLIDSKASSELLNKMLIMNSFKVMLFNLVIIALVPAMFEEIFFRGTLQPLLSGFTGNPHAGIIFCSIVFAAVHLNIYQIIPMLFLALVLGYLFYFTKSLWPGIIIHFFNNAFAVLASYYKNQNSLAKQVAEDTWVPGIAETLIFSAILIAIFYYFNKQTKLIANHE